MGNVAAVALFAVALWLRSDNIGYTVDAAALGLETVAFLRLGMTAWLGGELVGRLGVGVDEGAHLNAPNSLRTRHIPSTRH